MGSGSFRNSVKNSMKGLKILTTHDQIYVWQGNYIVFMGSAQTYVYMGKYRISTYINSN